MNRKEMVLVGMASSGCARHTPVQVQKLFFLFDREIPKLVGGPHFNFQPYFYGPFDKAVYDELVQLASEGYVDISPENTWLSYQLTGRGQEEGRRLLETLDKSVREYICQISVFVRSLSFAELVSAIYKAYPEMRQNSVFQGN